MAMTAWAAKFLQKFDLLFGKGPHLLTENRKGADELAFLEQRHHKQRTHTKDVPPLATASGLRSGMRPFVGEIDHVNGPPLLPRPA